MLNMSSGVERETPVLVTGRKEQGRMWGSRNREKAVRRLGKLYVKTPGCRW